MGLRLLSPTATTTISYQNFPTNPTKLPLFLLSFAASSNHFHTSSLSSAKCALSVPIHPLSSNSKSILVRPGRCRVASPEPPPPPQTDPPPGKDSRHVKGLVVSLSKFQDRVQIFFAVLFWMCLFFWASAWDGRNRPNKGSKFRR